jgi:hypothetical protein
MYSSKSSNHWLSELSQGYFLSNSTAHLSLLNSLNNHHIYILPCNYYPYWFEQRQNQIGDYGIYCALPCQNSNHKLVFVISVRTVGVILNSIATSKRPLTLFSRIYFLLYTETLELPRLQTLLSVLLHVLCHQFNVT